jgi:2-phospho-L-lactate guanylyltransferase
MSVFAIIPVSKLSEVKTRLSTIFSRKEREALISCMLEDVLDALDSLDRIVVISPSDLRGLKRNFDFILEKEEKGLNAAVEEANQYAIKHGAKATLFIPADLPLIKKYHINEILKLGRKNPLIISPSRGGGTGILFRKPPDIIEGRFTSTSFADHKKEAEAKGVRMYIYDSFSLSLDIDTPKDVKEFMLHGKGTKTYEFLKRLKF